MTKTLKIFFIVVSILALFTQCSEDDNEGLLPPYEERVATAITNLEQQLIAPPNGWKVQYQPEIGGGVFLLLLDFNENGEVTIQSDVSANGGEFFNQTIPYRVESSQGIELIFETYGIFHFLFELDQNTFGAEFEFLFLQESQESLLFQSATDIGIPSRVIFEPANAEDSDFLSRDIANNLQAFASVNPQLFNPLNPKVQITLNDANVSFFATLDPIKRVADFTFAGTGNSAENILASGNFTQLNTSTGYSLQEGKMVFRTPVEFRIGLTTYSIAEINLTSFESSGPNFCDAIPDDGPKYNGTIANLGTVTITSSLFEPSGAGFQPGNLFNVNSFFTFDGNLNSLEPLFQQAFPGVTSFIFFYGIDTSQIAPDSPIFGAPSYAIGFLSEDAAGNLTYQLREIEPTTTQGNRIAISFTDNYAFSGGGSETDRQNLETITNLMFEGNNVYLDELPAPNNGVFRLFNPCNRFELFLW